jgi:hypothetical protein
MDADGLTNAMRHGSSNPTDVRAIANNPALNEAQQN